MEMLRKRRFDTTRWYSGLLGSESPLDLLSCSSDISRAVVKVFSLLKGGRERASLVHKVLTKQKMLRH